MIKKRNIPYEDDNKDIDLNEKKFNTQKINKTYLGKYTYKKNDDFENTNKNINNSISHLIRNKKMISTPFLYNNNEISKENKTINNDDIILNYKINKIQQEINNLKEKNNFLLNNLNKEKEKNALLKSSQEILSENNIEQTLLEISKYFEVINIEEIPNKLSEMIDYISSNNNNIIENDIKNEFISNLKEIYKKANNIEDNNIIINMKMLWRWIKYLINNNKKIKNDIDKNTVLLQNIEKKSIFYKKNCEDIMDIYDMKNITEFNEFLNSLINKNNFYRKRIQQLKKMLSEDDNKNKNNKKIGDI